MGGAMFIAGMTSITEPPVNDLWTVPGEEEMLPVWKKEDSDFFNSVDSMYYYHREQTNDFLEAVQEWQKAAGGRHRGQTHGGAVHSHLPKHEG